MIAWIRLLGTVILAVALFLAWRNRAPEPKPAEIQVVEPAPTPSP